ncbi:hypothetical protein PSEUDO9AG_10040 [Pseudomonas sp. 9Ag]|nr:hypothetical protein PSEUDO9AG_10040 [Pseudomonas sp. 9Ag]
MRFGLKTSRLAALSVAYGDRSEASEALLQRQVRRHPVYNERRHGPKRSDCRIRFL